MSQAQGRAFLTARWVDLVMSSYEVDPAVLGPFVPAGTTLDPWNGRHFVSMVGFRFLDTRVMGVSVPLHRHFEEVNLRFYVRRQRDDEVRRGVVFLREIVPRRAIAGLANALYGERYLALPMTHERIEQEAGTTLVYRWKTGERWASLGARTTGAPSVPAPDSEEAFIAEHYWGYVRRPDGATLEYRVEHPPWAVWQADAPSFDCDVAAMYGAEFEPFLTGPPSSCFVAQGSDVIVRRGLPLRG
ncbi:MAG: DUF2071 domain-containing protein [Myxococcales bacterium]|jgi:uncharacterized protein YqjF (DUF2071 family)